MIVKVAMLIVVIAAMIWLMSLNYLMMILPKGKHIEFHNKNHPDNMGIEGIDNIHILDNRQMVAEHIAGVAEYIAGVAEHIAGVAEHIAEVAEHIAEVAEHIAGVAEHIAEVAEHIAGVAASVVEAVVVDIDNKHIQDGNDANVVVVAEEDIEGNIQQGILQ